jgi:hypothetical protein
MIFFFFFYVYVDLGPRFGPNSFWKYVILILFTVQNHTNVLYFQKNSYIYLDISFLT